MKLAKRIINFLVTVILYAVLPFVVTTMIMSQTGVLGGVRSFVVLTGSMEPAIPVGSVIYTKPYMIYSRGDVIAFEDSGRTVTHRIADVEDRNGTTFYTTRGDANNTDDTEEVAQSAVVGGGFAVIPGVGRFILYLKTVPGFVAFIIVPAALYIFYELWNIKKEIVKETERKMRAKLGVQAE